MSSRIRVEPVMLHPAGVMIYKAIYRRRVICLVRRAGGGWVAWDKEDRTTGTTAQDAAQNYYNTYLEGSN